MYLQDITIEGVAGIRDLSIDFDPRMNFICGPNGIGKTTILESVAHMFTIGITSILKRNSLSNKAHIKATIIAKNREVSTNLEFDTFTPDKSFQYFQGFHQYADKVIVLKTTRTFQYNPLNSVERDKNKDSHSSSEEAKNGISIHDVKNWFVNRYLYSAHIDSLNNQQIKNLDFAKSAFTILNKNFSFSRVNAASNDIMVNTPSGEIYYEYLSSGFKSTLSIILGIIKEIEYRFTSPRIDAHYFDGIIIIDELELHLHPEWQEKVAGILKEAFPKAQFICTTHSPHIIQFAQPNQIIALQFIENNVSRRDLTNNQFGFQGWTIEEILTDVMGMQDTRTTTFNNLIQQFDDEITNEDYTKADEVFKKIDSMLHPRNELRKILRLQLASIK